MRLRWSRDQTVRLLYCYSSRSAATWTPTHWERWPQKPWRTPPGTCSPWWTSSPVRNFSLNFCCMSFCLFFTEWHRNNWYISWFYAPGQIIIGFFVLNSQLCRQYWLTRSASGTTLLRTWWVLVLFLLLSWSKIRTESNLRIRLVLRRGAHIQFACTRESRLSIESGLKQYPAKCFFFLWRQAEALKPLKNSVRTAESVMNHFRKSNWKCMNWWHRTPWVCVNRAGEWSPPAMWPRCRQSQLPTTPTTSRRSGLPRPLWSTPPWTPLTPVGVTSVFHCFSSTADNMPSETLRPFSSSPWKYSMGIWNTT